MKLPKGWEIVRLQDMVSYVKGKKPRILSNVYKEGLVPYIDIKAFEKGKIRQYADVESSKLLKEDDILVVWDGARSGLVGIGRTGAIGSTIASLTPRNVNSKYLFYYLQTKYEFLNSNPRGTGIPHIDPNLFWNIEIPLAPLNEQRRIVAKLEKLLAKVDSCNERLEKIPAILKQFRQSVLTAACSGRLTQDWREKHPSVELTLEFLKKNQTKIIKSNNHYTGNTIEDRYLLISKNEDLNNTFELPEIPNTWRWARLADISDIQGGVTKGRKFGIKKTIMLPYLRVANVQDGYLDLSEIKYIEVLPSDLNKYHLENGDLLFTEGGDRDKLGRCAVWKNEIENCIHQNHIFRARLLSTKISSEYISLISRSDYVREYFFKKASQTVNLASINKTNLGSVPLAIAPIEEQHEIVRRVEALLKIADQIEGRYKKAKTYVERLTQAILAKAFRGELVPQDPNDEPASVLLERIRQEKAKLEKEKK